MFQLSTTENVDVGQLTNFAEKWKHIFSILIWPLGIKWNSEILLHIYKTYPNDILEYHLSTLWNVDRVPVTTTSPKTSFFGPYLTPRAKLKIPKPFCASTGHAQSDFRISFGYDLTCRQSSYDKKFFGRTEEWKGYNNMLELSLESTGIINIFTMITLTNLLA